MSVVCPLWGDEVTYSLAETTDRLLAYDEERPQKSGLHTIAFDESNEV